MPSPAPAAPAPAPAPGASVTPGAFVSVYVTAASEEEATRIARSLLERRLVACANVLPARSLYWWEGAIEESREVVMFMKTRRERADEVVRAVAEAHSYDVPCCVVLPLEAGLPAYLGWIAEETRSREKS